MEHSDDPFYYVDREAKWRRDLEDRRARYRGFADAGHFLDLAADRGPNAHVWREYRIIFKGELPLDTLPFPVIDGAA